MGLFSTIANVGGAAAGIWSLFQKDDPPEASKEQLAAARRAAEFSAMLDPNSPQHKALLAEEEARLGTAFAGDLKDLFTADRRAKARGTGGIINPERRDETFGQMFSRDRDSRRLRARDNVRSYLAQATGAMSGIPGMFAGPANMQSGYQQQNTMDQASGFNALFNSMRALDGTPTRLNINMGNAKPWKNPDTYSYDTPRTGTI